MFNDASLDFSLLVDALQRTGFVPQENGPGLLLPLLGEGLAPLVNTTSRPAGLVPFSEPPQAAAYGPPGLAGDPITGQLVDPGETYPSVTTFKYQGSAGSDVVAFGPGLGNERVLLSASSGPQGFRDGSADTVIWNFSNPAGLNVASNIKDILGFEAGTGSDVIAFAPGLLRDEDGNTLPSQILSRSALVNINAASTNLAMAATERVFIQFSGTGELRSAAFAGATTAGGGASAAALIGSRSLSPSQRLLFAFDDGSDSYLWYFNNGLGSIASRAEAAELALVGVVRGVTGFSNGDLAMADQALLSLNLPGTAGADSLVGGAGTDVIRPLAGNDRVVAGAGSDLILLDPGAGIDDLYLGAFASNRAQAIDGAADRVVWNYTLPASLAAAGQTANIVGFQSGSDVLEFAQGLLAEKNGTTSAGNIGSTLLNLSTSADLLGSNGIVFFQLAGVGDLTGAAAINSTSVAARLSGWNVESNTRFLFALDDGSDSYLWYHSYNGNDPQKNVIDANELRLVATLRQTTALASGDLRIAATTLSPTATVPRTADVVVPAVRLTAVGGADSTVSSLNGDQLVSGSATGTGPVALLLNGTPLGTATPEAGGAFAYTLTAADLELLGQGAGRSLIAVQDNGSGAMISSEPFSFAVDTIAPALAISAIGGADSTVSGQAGDNTVVGSAEAGRSVTLTFNGATLGSTTASATGAFAYTLTAANLTAIGQGADKAISASQSDAAGNTGSSSPFSFSVDTIAPSVGISGLGGSDRVVSSLPGDNVLNGSAEAGATVSLSSGGVLLGTTTADGTGAFTYSLTAGDLALLGQGSARSISASQSDAAGNTGSSSPFSFSVDTLAPAVVITAIGGADSTVTRQAGDNTVVGSAEAGRSVTLTFNGATLGSTTASATGAFAYTLTAANLTAVGQGADKAISASQSDAAGNTGSSSPFSFSVDTAFTGLTISAIGGSDATVSSQPGDNTVTGVADPGRPVSLLSGTTVLGSTTADAAGDFTYTLTAANLELLGQGAGRQISASQDNGVGGTLTTPAFSFAVDTIAPALAISAIGGADSTVSGQAGDNTVVGSAEAGRSVTLAFNGTTLGSTTASATGAFSYTLTAANLTAIGQGAGKAISASQSDAAGNSGSSAPVSFSVDSLAPTVSISGLGGSDRVVSSLPGDNVLSGSAEAGASVSLSSGGVLLGTTTASATGAFTYSLTAADLALLGQGSGKAITASQSDAAGNTGSSSPFSFSVDTLAPAVVITAIGGADSTVTSQAGDNTVVGSAEAGRSVTLAFNGTTLGSTTASATGAFSYTLTAANLTTIGQGAGKAISARQSDAAGNSGSSSPFSFSVNTAPPPPPTDDFAGGTGTTGTVTVGSSSSGNLERNGDRDWFRITLEGGRRYSFRLNGVTMADPQLRLRSSSGLEIAENNDANGSRNAEILFDISGSGTYYLEAGAAGDLGTGTYTLSASDITPAEPSRPYSSTDGYGEISVARALDQLTGQRLIRQPALGGVFWGLDRVGAPTAWAAGITGAGITVAVLDTGVDYLHPDIDANIWTNTREVAGNGIDDDRNGFIDDIRGWDFAYNDNNPSDLNGHGTHVAGTIAAENNGFGQTGVAYNAKIMPVKVLSDTGSGSFSNVARGIRYAADNGADVINLSLGGSTGSFELLEAVRYANARGAVLVMSSGNSRGATPGFPAAYAAEAGLAVGAVDSNGTFASFSNQAGSVEIDYVTAPGVNVYSLSPNNAYRSLSGTSMAAPHVAGVAALLLSYRPELTPVQLESLLISTTKPSADALATTSAPQAPAGGTTTAFAGEAPLIELPWIDDDDSASGGDDDNLDLEIDVATDAIEGLLPDELTITSHVAATPSPSIAADLQDAGINDSQSAEIAQMVFSNAIGDLGPMAGQAPSVDELADPSSLRRRLRHRRGPDEDPLEVFRRVWSRTHPHPWPSP